MAALSRVRKWAALVLLNLASQTLASADEIRPSVTAIPVRQGRAGFSVSAGESVVVVVSSLARSSGPFSVELKVRPSDGAKLPSWRQFPKVAEGGTVPPREKRREPCGIVAEKSGGEPTLPPGKRVFHLMTVPGDVAVAANYRPVTAKLRALGRAVQVYVDERDAGRVGTETLREVVSTLDDRVLPQLAATLGHVPDVDGDGRLTVLISQALTKLGGGRLAVDGFVRGADLDPVVGPPFGNRCDLIYLSTALGPGPYLRTILAHECTHAVVGGLKAFGGPKGSRSGPDEEGWLDEGMAHLMEDQFGFSRGNLDYRVAAFLAAPERSRLVVGDYYAEGLFRAHGPRGSTYLFLRWCAEHSGPDLLGRLARSPLRGIAAVEAETGAVFPDLFRRWTVSLVEDREKPNADGGGKAFDPYAVFGDWPLAGPRSETVRAGETFRWDATGTAPRFFRVEAGVGEVVEIEAPERAVLQVTAIPASRGLGEFRVEAVACANSGESGGTSLLRLMLTNRSAGPIRVDRVAWEPAILPAQPRQAKSRPGVLLGASLADRLGSAVVAAGDRVGPWEIALDAARLDDGPLVVKVVGIDEKGRRITAWADVNSTATVAADPWASKSRR